MDAQLLASVERLRGRTGESRSALIARALTGLVNEHGRQQRVRAYVQAYLERPESDTEVGRARKLARQSLSTVDWDEE